MENNGEEPSTAPEPGQWYNIKLGPSFKDNHNHSDHSPKLCTLRYEFKPASIDSSQPGSLHKSKDNRVTVEFQNNQQGKPKVIFEGIEDYRDNDAVLFFDGETFRLERLHRAVNCLRHVRLPGEPAAAAASTMTTSVVPLVESYTTPVGKGSKLQSSNIGVVHEALPQVEQIDIGNSTTLEPESGKDVEFPPSLPNPLTSSPDEPEENVDIVDGDDYGCLTEKGGNASEMEAHTGLDIDINLPHQMDIDVEIADVDISDNEADEGPNAAEALRAQVNAEGREGQSSSSSSSSDSESTGTESGSGSGSGSESGSVSTSTDTASSDGDSVNSV